MLDGQVKENAQRIVIGCWNTVVNHVQLQVKSINLMYWYHISLCLVMFLNRFSIHVFEAFFIFKNWKNKFLKSFKFTKKNASEAFFMLLQTEIHVFEALFIKLLCIFSPFRNMLFALRNRCYRNSWNKTCCQTNSKKHFADQFRNNVLWFVRKSTTRWLRHGFLQRSFLDELVLGLE